MIINKNIRKQIFFSAIGILAVATCISIFSGYGNRQLKRRLDDTAAELKIARDTISSVKESLSNLQQKLDVFKSKSDILSLQRDSLLLIFRRRNAADWNEVLKIEQEQKIMKEKLRILRQTENRLKW